MFYDVQRHTFLLIISTFLHSVNFVTTSLAGTVAKYCDVHVCLSARISLQPHARSLQKKFMHVAYGRGSILLRRR